MADIEKGKALKLENLISLRKKMTQEEMQQELNKLGNYMKENNIKKIGPLVSATFSVEEVNDRQILDSEFLIPVDRKVDLSSEYKFKEKFHLTNAIYTRHVGNLNEIQDTYSELESYIQKNELHQITATYNVNINESGFSQGAEPIIDIYIGINQSIL